MADFYSLSQAQAKTDGHGGEGEGGSRAGNGFRSIPYTARNGGGGNRNPDQTTGGQ